MHAAASRKQCCVCVRGVAASVVAASVLEQQAWQQACNGACSKLAMKEQREAAEWAARAWGSRKRKAAASIWHKLAWFFTSERVCVGGISEVNDERGQGTEAAQHQSRKDTFLHGS